jgi:hypothetical protein
MDQVGFLQGSLFALLLTGVGLLLVLCTRNHREDLRFQLRVFLVAFAVRYAFASLIYVGGLVEILKDEDAAVWEWGAAFAQQWSNEQLMIVQLPGAFIAGVSGTYQHLGYPYFLAIVFFVTNAPYRMVAAAVNCFCGALTVVFTFRIAKLLFTPWVARTATWLTCLLPSMITWSAMTIKEPVIILLETLALYGCLSLHVGRVSLRHLGLCFAAGVLLLPFRFYASYIVLLAVAIGLTVPDSIAPTRILRNVLLGVLIVVATLAAGMGDLGERGNHFTSLDQFQSFRKNVSVSGVGTGSGVETEDIRTSRGFVAGLVIGGLHLMLAPFPWQVGGGSTRLLLTIPEQVLWWWIFFRGFLPGLPVALRHQLKHMIIFLTFITCFAFLYSLTFGNVGLVFRQRAQLLPWLLIISMVGFEERMLRRRKLLLISPGSPSSPAFSNMPACQAVSEPQAQGGWGLTTPTPVLPDKVTCIVPVLTDSGEHQG